MAVRIVVLDGYTVNPGDLSWDPLAGLGELRIHNRTQPDRIIERSMEADILVLNKVRIKGNTIRQLKKLRCICMLATGYDNVDMDTASEQGVAVYNAVGYGTESVAQHAISLMLTWTNHVSEYSNSVKKGGWRESLDFTYQLKPVFELRGKKLGLFGLGKIGSRVAELGLAFGMEVQAFVRDQSNRNRQGVDIVSREKLFESSDFLSLHVPLTESTKHIIHLESLDMMKSDAILVNTSRGALVVEQDLYKALQNKTIKGAALDVLAVEPPVDRNPLTQLDNCIITPHMAWTSAEARRELIRIVADNIKAFLIGSTVNRVN